MANNPTKKPTNVYSVLLPNEATTLDADAFDALVHNQGIRLIHHRAIKCPVGLLDPSDVRRVHADHSGCSNGYIFKPIGRVTAIFVGNQTELKKLDAGMVDGSTVAVSFPRFYDTDSEKRVLVRPADRFYLEEEGITSADWDLTKRRQDGRPDQLRFPARRVHHLIDSNGREWDGSAYDLVEGDLRWRDNQGPPPGTVYSVWYEYQPYYYVERLVHEIRVVPVADYLDANKVGMERLSFGAILSREYIHRDQAEDIQAPKSNRQQLPPEADEFGTR